MGLVYYAQLQLVVAIVVIFVSRSLWRRWKYDLHKIPSPPSVPFFGNTFDFAKGQRKRQVTVWFAQKQKDLDYPKVMKIELGAFGMGFNILYVADMETCRSIFASKTMTYPRDKIGLNFVRQMFTKNEKLTTFFTTPSSTPYVKAIRRVYASGLTNSNLSRVLPTVRKVVRRFLNCTEEDRSKGPVDIQDLCVRLTADVIGLVAFDVNVGALDGTRDVYKHLLDVTQVAVDKLYNNFKRLYADLFHNSKLARQWNSKIDILMTDWSDLTDEILAKDDPPADQDPPMWHVLRTVKNPDTGMALSRELLEAEIGTVVFGGTDTTGRQLAWFISLLASHPRVVNKLLDELKEQGLYGPDARDVTFEDLAHLTYLSATIKEGLRVAHIFNATLFREAPQDTTIMGYRIPKGTLIAVPGNRAVNCERDYEDPHAFKPERWLTDEDMSNKFYLGFGWGNRDCVGQRLAMLELRVTTIELISKYDIALRGTFEELSKNTVDGAAISAKDGIWIDVKPRESLG